MKMSLHRLSIKNGGKGGIRTSVPLAQYTGLAVQHLKPLSHLSARLRGRKIDKRFDQCKGFKPRSIVTNIDMHQKRLHTNPVKNSLCHVQ